MAEEDLRVNGALVIPAAELQWRFSRSSGPGGQHANKADTRVELRVDLAASPTIAPRMKERLVARLGPVVRVAADDERSQARNRDHARARLRATLLDALHEERPRRKTKPSKGAKQRRLEAKRKQGQKKRDRRWSGDG